ncbi:hypothetical protein A6V36_27350 [Paraburkholderia ginsengiterrae]|uniref:Solute-binding protein family 3/N-terminal domain-containing protein n=1 Tax=Paraburkholderia ginsengiterrae TaxID=1462993 RepID=A0A1A9NAT7_9BURK|nr:hypothetical protein [Paraburkholderia ginsengiterrae]OAJ59367.1 hypothetical protein A6V36_27350 [Paraburkholderia ginsengiterrae]OAJ63280.1 hypothetical protein A6V37_20495 [Paraburkholderia ginsengiterrae]
MTLGPSGSNHEFVATRYLKFHGLDDKATIQLVLDFDSAARAVINGDADYLIQVAVHPETTEIVARYRKHLFVVDAFVSGSKDMAIVTRVDVERPTSLALQPATREYVDTTDLQLIPETSTASVAEGLLSGKYESGLTYSSLALDNPSRFRLDEVIGTVDDPWIVYGRERLSKGQVVTWKDSPAGRAYQRELQQTAN